MISPPASKEFEKLNLSEALTCLLRGEEVDLEAHISCIERGVKADQTEAQVYSYQFLLDTMAQPSVKDFAAFVAACVLDFVIPRPVRDAVTQSVLKSGSFSPYQELDQQVRELFVRDESSGEGGEVLLSVLAERVLKLPQVFSKMPLKTSSEMHVHGADGIHAGVDSDTGHLKLYWGESKLYSSPSNAIKDCFSSIAPILLDRGGLKSPRSRDLMLFRGGLELGDETLESAILGYLDPKKPLVKKVKFCGVCLIGYDSKKYPTEPSPDLIEKVEAALKKEFIGRKKTVSERILENKIESFEIHVFALPFPSVDEFRQEFRRSLGIV